MTVEKVKIEDYYWKKFEYRRFHPISFWCGGYWQVIDEIPDPTVIQQQDRLSCGPACAEMLLKENGISNVTQARVADMTGTPVNVQYLAQALNQLDNSGLRNWIGGGFEIRGVNETELLKVLMGTGSFMAELREPGARLGHLVVVDGYDENGFIKIRDPWDGTKYKMEQEEFF